MSIRQLRVRLDRLARSERSAIEKQRDPTPDFNIDQTLAKALFDAEERMVQLWRKESAPSENGGPITPAEKQEESRLCVRVDELRARLECPEGYGYKESMKDGERWSKLDRKRMSLPNCGGGPC